jgi:putative two-component system response regulator
MDAETATERRRVLVSDDEPDFAKATKLYFEAEGYDVRATTRAGETLDWARSWQPHVITTDVFKPGQMDGLEMTRRLKADDETRNIPVIVASASCGHKEGRRQALDAGAWAVPAKPLDPKEFLRLMQDALGE